MRCIYTFRSLRIRLIDLNCVLQTYIEPQIENDNYKFNIQKNNKLSKKFTVYRICKMLLQVLKNNTKIKNIFYLNESVKLSCLYGQETEVYKLLQQIGKILSLNMFLNNKEFSYITKTLVTNTGEGKELKAILTNLIYRKKYNPNIEKFKKFLKKYDIHKLEGDIDNNFNIKLGLYIA